MYSSTNTLHLLTMDFVNYGILQVYNSRLRALEGETAYVGGKFDAFLMLSFVFWVFFWGVFWGNPPGDSWK